jgi:hypothetical protein
MDDQNWLLAGLQSHNAANPWMVSPRTVFLTPEDQAEQLDMHECCMFVPFALTITDRVSGRRVWFKVYDDAEELVQKVLDFALTTTPDFYYFAMTEAYNYWVRNGRKSMWDPKMFLEIISQRTYFLWSSTPNFDLKTDESENDWTPAAKEWADVHLQDWISPTPDVSNSVYPEFFFRPSEADRWAELNKVPLLVTVLDPVPFMIDLRKTRFLTLGLPAVTFVQALRKQYLIVSVEIVQKRITAQISFLMSCRVHQSEYSQARQYSRHSKASAQTPNHKPPMVCELRCC